MPVGVIVTAAKNNFDGVTSADLDRAQG